MTVTDRGPNFRLNRVLDLSEAAAKDLDYIQKGLTQVYVSQVMSYEPQHAEVHALLVEPPEEMFESALILPEDTR